MPDCNIILTGFSFKLHTLIFQGSEDTFRENDKKLGSKLLNYHGLSALNTTVFPTWDSFFINLLDQPDTVLMISTPKGEKAAYDVNLNVNYVL